VIDILKVLDLFKKRLKQEINSRGGKKVTDRKNSIEKEMKMLEVM